MVFNYAKSIGKTYICHIQILTCFLVVAILSPRPTFSVPSSWLSVPGPEKNFAIFNKEQKVIFPNVQEYVGM